MIYRDYLKDKNQNSIKFKEVEGTSPLAFSHSKGRDLKNYQIYGNSTQKTTGKNLISSLPYYNPTPDDNFSVIFEKGKTYTFSFESSTSSKWRLMIWGTEIDGSDLNTGSNGYLQGMYCSAAAPNRLQDSADRTTNSYTYLCNKSFVAVRIAFWNTDNGASDTITNPQLELGSTATDYEAYHTSPSPEFPSEVESVGDLTTKNLLYPYSNAISRTLKGVTMTYDNGVITLNGTCTASANFDLYNIALSANTYTLSANANKVPVNNGYAFVQLYDSTNNQIITLVNSNAMSSVTTTISDGTFLYRIRIDEGTTYDNVVLKPQLEIGSTATEYEPYHKYDIPITVRGKNLLPYPYIFTTKTINGVTFTDNGDGSITVNGTATANAVFYLVGKQDNYTLDKCGLKIGDSYTISKTLISGDSIANVYFTANYYNTSDSMKQGALATSTNTSTSKIQSDFKSWGIYLLVAKDKTVNNTTIKFQLEKGSSATAYEPYIPPVTTNIYLDEPLRKVGDYADYIDFKNQKVVRNAAETTFNGSEAWVKTGDVLAGVYQGFAVSNSVYNIPKGTKLICLSDKFPYASGKAANIVTIGDISAYGLRIIIGAEYVPDLDVTTFKTWLSANNVKIIYPIATPTEEPISLPALKTFKGTTIISVDTSIQTSNIKGKYIRT